MKDWKLFIKGGRAIFTVENAVTGNRFTYQVKRAGDGRDLLFVFVLSGPDNCTDYQYIGAVKAGCFGLTRKSRVSYGAPSYKAFAWLNDVLNSDSDLPECVKIWHAGRCGRCGRLLTVPQSVEWGFGPECILHVLGCDPRNHVSRKQAVSIQKLMRLQASAAKLEAQT